MSVNLLIEYFEKIVALSSDEKQEIEKYFTLRRLKKKHFLHREGEVCHYSSFVVSGALRCFMMDENFKEHNTQFAFEHWWITDFGSFFKKEKSRMNIQALENSVVLMISSYDHMVGEEMEINPLVWDNFADPEIAGWHGQIMATMKPEDGALWFKYIVPALNKHEQVMLLGQFKGSVPTEAYEGTLQMLKPELTEKQFKFISSI